MLTEYNGQVFKADRYGVQVLLWRYTPVDGFTKKTDKKGIPYYSDTVGMGEVGKFFTVQFYVKDADKRFLVNGLHVFFLDLISTDGSFIKRTRVTDFKEFLMVETTDEGDTETVLSLTEFFEKWRIYKTEVGDNQR